MLTRSSCPSVRRQYYYYYYYNHGGNLASFATGQSFTMVNETAFDHGSTTIAVPWYDSVRPWFNHATVLVPDTTTVLP